VLQELQVAKKDWTAMGPSAMVEQGLRWRALEAGGGKLQREGWLSLLMEPGTMCVKATEDFARLVVASTAHGFQSLKVRLRKNGTVNLHQVTSASVLYDQVLDPHQWRVAGTEVVLPQEDAEGEGRSAVQLKRAAGGGSLLRHAARGGFRRLGVMRLRKLWLVLSEGNLPDDFVLGSAPEDLLVTRLAKAVLGDATTEEQIATLLEERHKCGAAWAQEDQEVEFLEQELGDILDEQQGDEYDENDIQKEISALQEEAERRRQARQRRAASAAAAAAAPPEGAGAAGEGGAPRRGCSPRGPQATSTSTGHGACAPRIAACRKTAARTGGACGPPTSTS
jgi:hypothetical protein